MRAKVNYWLAPGLHRLEMTCADYVSQKFSHHWHTGFAIGIVTRNAQGFRTGGRDWTIAQGDVILLNPGQIHNGYSLDPGGWSSRMAYAPAEVFWSLSGHTAKSGSWPFHFPSAVVHAPALAAAFLSWHQRSETQSNLCSIEETKTIFSALLAHAKAGAPSSEISFQAQGTGPLFGLRPMDQQGDARVATLSAELELTRNGSWRRVKTQLGIAPKPLLSHMRLMCAKHLLAQGKAVIETALDSGYYDQSHFSRQFAAAYGFTPAQFRTAQLASRRADRITPSS